MERENGKLKKRRRVRWGRLVLFLLALTTLVYGIGRGVVYISETGRLVYQEYSALIEGLEAKRTLPAKFQEARFEDYTNILLLGIDDGQPGNEFSARCSDTVIVASIRRQDGFVRLLSIPGSTLVKIPGRAQEEPIRQAYYYGGVQLIVRTAEDFLQIPLHHYIAVDMEATASIIDAMGGVNVYVEHQMDYEDSYADLAIHLKKGYQRLDGQNALYYLRYRSDEIGDIGRVQRQQKFVKQLYGEFLQTDTISKLPQIVEIISNRVTTSLALLDTARMAESLSGCRADLIEADMLPGRIDDAQGQSYWRADPAGTAALLDEMFQSESTAPQTEQKN